ncbi:MAG: ribonuclease HI [bacterium]|nr:ribonuclease HI [bacterium]
MITIYTDGASRGNPGPGGWGAVISYQKIVNSRQQNWITEIGGREKHTTNNRMELTGAISALEFTSQLSTNHYLLFTDSEYVMKGMTIWIHSWQKKGWRTAGRKPVLNQDLWQKLLRVAEGKKVEWKYVAGHAGIPLNERADEIATSFADNFTPALYNGPRTK